MFYSWWIKSFGCHWRQTIVYLYLLSSLECFIFTRCAFHGSTGQKRQPAWHENVCQNGSSEPFSHVLQSECKKINKIQNILHSVKIWNNLGEATTRLGLRPRSHLATSWGLRSSHKLSLAFPPLMLCLLPRFLQIPFPRNSSTPYHLFHLSPFPLYIRIKLTNID